MAERILVTGAAGFIGSYLVNFLSERQRFIFGTRHLARSKTPISPKVKIYDLNVASFSQTKLLFKKIRPTKIYHLAAQSYPTVSWERPQYTISANVIGTINIYEAILKNKLEAKVLLIGSSAQYGFVPEEDGPVKEFSRMFPLHPYGISKVAQELLALQYFKNFKIPSIVIRTFNTTGPGKQNDVLAAFTKQVVLIKKRGLANRIYVGNLTTKRAFVDVRDMTNAFFLGMERGVAGEVYNVCGSQAYLVGDILKKVLKIGKISPQVIVSRGLLRPTDEPIIFGDSQKFRKLTGWRQKTLIDKTIKDMIIFWEKNMENEPYA